MTERIRRELRIELAKRNWKAADLARASGVTAQHVRALQRRERGDLSRSWERIFDALGLELTLTRKQDSAQGQGHASVPCTRPMP